jgi:hypothetical protein
MITRWIAGMLWAASLDLWGLADEHRGVRAILYAIAIGERRYPFTDEKRR